MVTLTWLHQQHTQLEICTVGTYLLKNKDKNIASSSESVPIDTGSSTTLRANMLMAQSMQIGVQLCMPIKNKNSADLC